MYTGGFKYHKINGENTIGLVYIWLLFWVINEEMNLFQMYKKRAVMHFLDIRRKVTLRGICVL